MIDPELGFVHRYIAGADRSGPTLLLLHGTGGNEEDLLPLGRMLAPGVAVLSPRGKVLENGMPRFFRRLAEGVFDVDDLRRRAAELARFVTAASDRYGFDRASVIAAGFSNGANIATALMLLEPRILADAILFRAMVPLVPTTPPSLTGTRVLLSHGERDPLVAREDAERLASMLREAGAEVTHAWQPAGHELTSADISAARRWLAPRLAAGRTPA